MLGYNIQNLLILYILNLFCLIQWVKILFKKFLEITYYWFHIQYDEKLLILLIEETTNIINSLFCVSIDLEFFNNLKIISNLIVQSNESLLWKYIIWLNK